jgi:fucose permease
MIGLALYATACFLFAAGSSFFFFLALLVVSGLAVGLFKTGALALIGDISESSKQHAATMNTTEGYFGVGAIIGPLIVTALLGAGVSWTWLYIIAGGVCMVLLALASRVQYPEMKQSPKASTGLSEALGLLRDPYALLFSIGIALYVATEVAIYVWMPTFLKSYDGQAQFFAAYALTIFFVLRAGGRFLGAWVLRFVSWQKVMALFATLIFACFAGSVLIGVKAAVYLLPISGLFMSMIYPTLNAKGIACFPKARSGAIAGVILFFTAAAAALGPLAMGAVGDLFGDVIFGFYLATGFAGLLCVGLVYNLLHDPAADRHREIERADYS